MEHDGGDVFYNENYEQDMDDDAQLVRWLA
jgi:hypothetical protein